MTVRSSPPSSEAVESTEKPSSPTAGSSPSPDKQSVQAVEPEATPDGTGDYVTGLKLVLVVAGVALACFLMLIDTMIISTVHTESIVC